MEFYYLKIRFHCITSALTRLKPLQDEDHFMLTIGVLFIVFKISYTVKTQVPRG